MKNDTPRTDALLFPDLDLADAHDIVDLCRQLERELLRSEFLHIYLGEFTFERIGKENKLWLRHLSGEGMEVDEAIFSTVIRTFFHNYF